MDPRPVTIRPGSPDDAAALAGVQRAAALAAFEAIFPAAAPKPTLAALRAGWSEVLADPAARVLVAETRAGGSGAGAGSQVTGGAAVVPAAGEAPGWLLAGLYVHPESWGRGIGTALHDAALAAAVAVGAPELALWVLERNAPARRMYERRGWRLVPGVQRSPFGPEGPHEVQYRRSLGQRGSGNAVVSLPW